MRLFTLILLITATLNVFAQQTTDVVYLKDGSIIKGKIIEKTDNKIKIETCCENIFAYSSTDIDKMETLNQPLPGYLKSKGYFNYTSMGFLAGSNSADEKSIFSVLMEHNYQFNPYFSTGAVTGIEFFNESVAPLGINVKGMIPTHSKTVIYVSASCGYSIPLEEVDNDNYYEFKDTKGGIFAGTEMGIVLPSKSNTNMFFSLGYRYNELNYTRYDWYFDDVERKVTYNRLSLKFGIVLH